MSQATALSPGSLLGQGVITTAATPLMGYCNVYNAAAGPLAPRLRQAALGTLGTTCLVEKDPNDATNNPVTVACYSGETFSDGSISRTLTNPGDFLMLALLAIDGVAKWRVVGGGNSAPGPRDRGNPDIDGGGAGTVFDDLLTIDGGSANSTYTGSLTFDGGGAVTPLGQGQGLYVAPDGSLHYLGPTTDTVLAPA